MKIKKYSTRVLLTLLSILILGMFPYSPDEGMYPLSEIHKIDLVKAGLKINPLEVYNPNGVSLIDALVNVGGCTGSFVSPEGLILTNHHCAFSAINAASTPEHNYLENGFLAKTHQKEIPAKGKTVKITESYRDVSKEILDAVKGIEDLTERSKIIKTKMAEISSAADDSLNSIVGNVSEMFKGKTYILFRYKIIKDVRLVYAPPRTIGEFGGETDNWIWPRHSGDFTFMRAYVAPDGSSAEYSPDNVPYKPKKFLEINPNGVNEGDFVFILGYPGRTYRHRPSYFLQYQKNYQLPYISETFDWMIKKYEEISGNNIDLQLKFATKIKRLANTMKNYNGKLLGLKRIGLIKQKQNEEKELQNFIDSNPKLKYKYGNLLNDFKTTYTGLFNIAEAQLWFIIFNRFTYTKRITDLLLAYNKNKDENETDVTKIKKEITSLVKTSDKIFETAFLKKLLNDAKNFTGKSEIKPVKNFLASNTIESIDKSKIFTPEGIATLLNNPALIETEPIVNLVKHLDVDYQTIKKTSDKIEGSLLNLSAALFDIKHKWKKTNFIPDANGTLRLTYGYIKGYSPADAVYYSPITTLNGVIDKSYFGNEYAIPDKLRTLYANKDFGKFYNKELDSVPVGILYNTDTTGGNSGSPVMDAYGKLIGLNFDRAYEATINDYAWNESYSRSIGVDIRYVLWITQKLGGADFLLKEMGVE